MLWMLAVAATMGTVFVVCVIARVSLPVLFKRFDKSGMVKCLVLLTIIIVELAVPEVIRGVTVCMVTFVVFMNRSVLDVLYVSVAYVCRLVPFLLNLCEMEMH